MDIQADLRDLCDLAIASGATRATAIEADKIIVEERVQLKCRYPSCDFYGRNRMRPPFTPTAKEFNRLSFKVSLWHSNPNRSAHYRRS